MDDDPVQFLAPGPIKSTCICQREHDAHQQNWYCLVHGQMTWAEWDARPLKEEYTQHLMRTFRRPPETLTAFFALPIDPGLTLTEENLAVTLVGLPHHLRQPYHRFRWYDDFRHQDGQRWAVIEACYV